MCTSMLCACTAFSLVGHSDALSWGKKRCNDGCLPHERMRSGKRRRAWRTVCWSHVKASAYRRAWRDRGVHMSITTIEGHNPLTHCWTFAAWIVASINYGADCWLIELVTANYYLKHQRWTGMFHFCQNSVIVSEFLQIRQTQDFNNARLLWNYYS